MSRSKGPSVAVIMGTGIPEHFRLGRTTTVETRYGDTSVYDSPDGRCFFLPRHGSGHTLPPHRINYRANLAALQRLGVKNIIATSAVGTMTDSFKVGDVGTLDQFIDFTRSRPSTFYEDEVVHTDMTHPYSRELNGSIKKAAKSADLRLRTGLVYVCVEGPRFETAAEIKMFNMLGGDVVGMTGVPEVVLARERGMSYACIVIATNRAAGSQEAVSHTEVLKVMKETGARVKRLVEETVNLLQ